MRRIFFSITIFIFSQLLLSCGNTCGCKRSDPVNSHFDITGMSVYFTDINEKYNNPYVISDTSLKFWEPLPDSSTISAKDFGLFISFKVRYYAALRSVPYSMIPSAYACSPISIGQNGSEEIIDSLYIIPVTGSFGNDTLYTDTLFTIERNYASYSMHTNDTTLYLTINNERSYNFFPEQNGFRAAGTGLLFQGIPKGYNATFSTSGFQQLRVVLRLKNGERYEAMTPYIQIE